MVAVVPEGGAIGVGHGSYTDRCVWLQARLSYYLRVHRWRAVGGVPWCSGWGVVAVAPGCHGPYGHPPALGREAGEPLRPQPAPQLPVRGGAQGSGPSGVVGSCQGEPHKVDLRDGGDFLGPQKDVYPVQRLGRPAGGHGAQALPGRGGWGCRLGPALGPRGSWRRGGAGQSPGALARGPVPCGLGGSSCMVKNKRKGRKRTGSECIK